MLRCLNHDLVLWLKLLGKLKKEEFFFLVCVCLCLFDMLVIASK